MANIDKDSYAGMFGPLSHEGGDRVRLVMSVKLTAKKELTNG